MNDLAARRAQAPAFPLPGTNYQMQTSALGKPDTFVSPPNMGISLREHIAVQLLPALIAKFDVSETAIIEAFSMADEIIRRGTPSTIASVPPTRNN